MLEAFVAPVRREGGGRTVKKKGVPSMAPIGRGEKGERRGGNGNGRKKEMHFLPIPPPPTTRRKKKKGRELLSSRRLFDAVGKRGREARKVPLQLRCAVATRKEKKGGRGWVLCKRGS